MNELRWWFRFVGMIYIVLGAGFFPAINEMRFKMIFPVFDAPYNGIAYRGLLDFTFMLGLDLLVLGAYLLYASSEPLRHFNLVWLILWMELVRGVFDDTYMIARGYSPWIYIIFISGHLLIILTGILFMSKAKRWEEDEMIDE